MPHINVKVPKGVFPPEARNELVWRINDAAATAEQIPDDPQKRFLSWVVVEETEVDLWTCGGIDVSRYVLPCLAMVYVPAGVLDPVSRALYVKLIDAAFKQALPATEKRQVVTSVVLHDVADGTWGGNGTLWTLSDLAKATGYVHLRHLAEAA